LAAAAAATEVAAEVAEAATAARLLLPMNIAAAAAAVTVASCATAPKIPGQTCTRACAHEPNGPVLSEGNGRVQQLYLKVNFYYESIYF